MKVRLPKNNSGGMSNLQQLAKKAQETQEQMEQASAELENKEYSATSGGGVVEVLINGKLEIQSIKIKPEIVNKDDINMLSDLIKAAVNEAIKKANDEKEKVMQNISSNMNIPGLL